MKNCEENYDAYLTIETLTQTTISRCFMQLA